MPVISMFYGILVYMYFFDNKQHKMPHIHAKYQDEESIFNILTGEILDGNLRQPKADWFRPGLKFTEMNCWPTGSLRQKANQCLKLIL